MSDANGHTHHAVDYLELVAVDLDEARRFYAGAFGWTFNDYGPDYTGFADGGRAEGVEAGGIRRIDGEVVRGSILPVLYSSDLEATRDAVVDAGGVIEVDIFEFPGGRRFQFLDPAGNELAVWGS